MSFSASQKFCSRRSWLGRALIVSAIIHRAPFIAFFTMSLLCFFLFVIITRYRYIYISFRIPTTYDLSKSAICISLVAKLQVVLHRIILSTFLIPILEHFKMPPYSSSSRKSSFFQLVVLSLDQFPSSSSSSSTWNQFVPLEYSD